jgi:hypothetical protein
MAAATFVNFFANSAIRGREGRPYVENRSDRYQGPSRDHGFTIYLPTLAKTRSMASQHASCVTTS